MKEPALAITPWTFFGLAEHRLEVLEASCPEEAVKVTVQDEGVLELHVELWLLVFPRHKGSEQVDQRRQFFPNNSPNFFKIYTKIIMDHDIPEPRDFPPGDLRMA
jgi:hypothetical protein